MIILTGFIIRSTFLKWFWMKHFYVFSGILCLSASSHHWCCARSLQCALCVSYRVTTETKKKFCLDPEWKHAQMHLKEFKKKSRQSGAPKVWHVVPLWACPSSINDFYSSVLMFMFELWQNLNPIFLMISKKTELFKPFMCFVVFLNWDNTK